MRIAYVSFYLDGYIAQGGVGQKIRAQMKSWRDLGHETALFTLSPDDWTAEDVQVFRYAPLISPPFLKSATRFVSRSAATLKLLREVRRYQPDFIYLRGGLYVYPSHRLYKIAPLAMELNSLDLKESRYQGLLFHWFNQLTRGIMFRRAAGLVAVSHEIAQAPENARYRKPVRVIANGYDLQRDMFLPAPSNPKPALSMVASPGMTWHGVDKLLWLARQYPDLTINVVGYRREDLKGDIPQNLCLHGFLPRERAREILKTTDAVFGSLALHRNDMKEASPLKVREAAACGIPLILGYRDTDLSDWQTDCILHIPNTEDNVQTHAAQIRDFAYRMRGRRLDAEMVAARIGQRQKEEERLAFFEKIRAAAPIKDKNLDG
ncbi:MAG: glycosyltransferase [Chloroflexi bacterium]|nr:glycosyltransferase [Chloroflexota bacterium]